MAAANLFPSFLSSSSSSSTTKKKKTSSWNGFRANLAGDNDPMLQTAISRASLRFQESLKPEPLFLDPYAGCFVDFDVQKDMKQSPLLTASTSHYGLATKFIDDRLLSAVKGLDGIRQIVLLTDGMDTRPYRLKWPNATILFDISSERIFNSAAQKLEGVGASIPKSCLFIHIPSESSDKQEILCRKGFNGTRPSIWALQGLPLMTLACFMDILLTVSNLAAEGCYFIGELPAWLTETEVVSKSDTLKWIDKLFMSNGFRVDVITYDEAAKHVSKNPPSGDYGNILFVAKQLRLSDTQIDSWRTESSRIEAEGDEEGFEEL